MDDGEVDVSNQEYFSNSMGEIPCSGSMDSFFDELLKDTHACTHTHTCNPPGPDYSHTHTCFHVHTKIVSAPSDDNGGNSNNDNSAESMEKKTKKRPTGNREAVRKYREKKKARAASLEDEVVKLRALNQQLLKRLQGQAALEAEVARLKCLLVDIRGRIEGEIGSFPYQKSVKTGDSFQNIANPGFPGSYVMNPCNVQCGEQNYCLQPGVQGKNIETSLNDQAFSGCDFENLNCFANMGNGSKECLGNGPCDMGNMSLIPNSTGDSKREAGVYVFQALQSLCCVCIYDFTFIAFLFVGNSPLAMAEQPLVEDEKVEEALEVFTSRNNILVKTLEYVLSSNLNRSFVLHD